jgi:hypothetical protein
MLQSWRCSIRRHTEPLSRRQPRSEQIDGWALALPAAVREVRKPRVAESYGRNPYRSAQGVSSNCGDKPKPGRPQRRRSGIPNAGPVPHCTRIETAGLTTPGTSAGLAFDAALPRELQRGTRRLSSDLPKVRISRAADSCDPRRVAEWSKGNELLCVLHQTPSSRSGAGLGAEGDVRAIRKQCELGEPSAQ